MNFPTIEDLKPLIASGALTHVSFDVFDTFLLRRCSLPVGVFERAYYQLPGNRTSQSQANAYSHYRQSAEQAARARSKKESGRHEVTIEQIYAHFPPRPFGLTLAQRPACAQAEYAAEQALCFVHDQALTLYRALQQAGVKVGFLSDTYWNKDQLSALLTGCVPGLRWDFLYASCDHGVGKSSGLFQIYLKEQQLATARIAHIGDNPQADILPARALGIRAFHCPQMTPADAILYQRERTTFDLFCTGLPIYQDDGLTTLRRRVLAALPPFSHAQTLGAQVMGPVMMAFDQFVRDTITELSESQHPDTDSPRHLALAFLARDGYFPRQVYQQAEHHPLPAAYLAINRRIALIASRHDTSALAGLFNHVPLLDWSSLQGFLHFDTPTLRAYFARQPGGIVTGKTFSQDLPDLLSPQDMEALSHAMRGRLLAYLRREIPNIEQVTDLILVDIGYGGSVQAALRNTLDAVGLEHIRLHGRYLIPHAEALNHVPDSDSAEGLIDDSILSPHVNISLRHNVALLEQIWGAPHGSVKDYDAEGRPHYEQDPRSQQQLAISEEIRQGAYAFIAQARHLNPTLWPLPSLAPSQGRPWAAALIARLLLAPTDDELCLFQDFKLDVNLGSQAQIPLLDAPSIYALTNAKATLNLFHPSHNAIWTAGQLATVSPLHGYLYSLFAAQKMPGDVFGDAQCGDLSVMILGHDQPRMVKTACLRTADNLLRLRVLLPGPAEGLSVLLPLEELGATEAQGAYGHITGLTWQTANSAAKVMTDTEPTSLSLSAVSAISDASLTDGAFAVTGPRPYLAFSVPAIPAGVGLLTLTIRLLDNRRLLALTIPEKAAAQ